MIFYPLLTAGFYEGIIFMKSEEKEKKLVFRVRDLSVSGSSTSRGGTFHERSGNDRPPMKLGKSTSKTFLRDARLFL